MNQEKPAEAIVVIDEGPIVLSLKNLGKLIIPLKHRKHRGTDQKMTTYRGIRWKRKRRKDGVHSTEKKEWTLKRLNRRIHLSISKSSTIFFG